MSLLGFLQSAKVEEVQPQQKQQRVSKQRNPAEALLAIRVFANGSIFPSQALVDKFDLEYRDAAIRKETLPLKDGETIARTKNVYDFPNGVGNGFDLIDTRSWTIQWNASGHMLLLAATPKDAGKVDLFSSVAYDDKTGKPKVSVMEQGVQTFGKDVLVPAIEEVYGITFAKGEIKDEKGTVVRPAVDGVDYVDMLVAEEVEGVNITARFSKDITFVPKKVTRGEHKGKSDYERREGVKLYGFVPASVQEAAEPSNGKAAPVDMTEATVAQRNAFHSAIEA